MAGAVEEKRLAKLTRKALDLARSGYERLIDLEDKVTEAIEELEEAVAILELVVPAEEEKGKERSSPSFPPREPGERRWYDGFTEEEDDEAAE